MSLRTPQKELERTGQAASGTWVDPDRLAEHIRRTNQPVPLQELARQAVRAHWVDDSSHRIYAPGRAYRVGERLRLLDGRLGDVVAVGDGVNDIQGAFKVLTIHLAHREKLQLAAEVAGAVQDATPNEVSDDAVEQVLAEQGQDVVRDVRQVLASDPRFITLYYRNGEFGCLREFFPPMSPDVLDAAVALLLDAYFDQIQVSRVTASAGEDLDEGPRRGSSRSVEALFSTDPFEEAIADFPETRQAEEAVSRQFETVHALWEHAERFGATWDASQMARNFVQPLFRALGWSTVTLSALSGASEGVYALCIDDTAAAELFMDDGVNRPFARRVPALAEVIAWDWALDQTALPAEPERPRGREAMEREPSVGPLAPGHQLIGEMRRVGARWGVLTNGRSWRLFSAEASSVARTFYELDLSTIFSGLAVGTRPGLEQWQAFQRWWLLFRQSSYTTGSDGRCLVERLRLRIPRDEVRARELLRERLLGVALPAIAGGFISYRHQRLGIAQETPATLQVVHRASVLLATRLLLTLIAEARGLLPVDDPDFRPYSLTAQGHWAVERMSRGLPLSSGVYTTPRYDLVVALLHRLSKGDPEKSVPGYGRQLFDPGENEDHGFLERTHLSDEAVGRALDALYRSVDYSALDARDLIAVCGEMIGTRLVLVDAEGSQVVITREGAPRTVADDLPDYVVATSAGQAVAPVLEARGRAFEAAMDRVVKLRRSLRRALDRRRRAALYAEWESAAREARRTLLTIRACDPAMGSGAFLLGVADALTDGIIAVLQAYHTAHRDVPRDWNPVYKLIDDVRRDIIDELERRGLTADVGALNDASLLSRLVVERALFGVAPDRAAVEVAKAAFWLHTFIPGMPVSYLQHHLRVGNAVLGADLAQVALDLGLPDLPQEVAARASQLYPLTERVDTTLLDVQWSAGQAAEVDETLRPYRLLFDMVVSAALGDAEAAAALQSLAGERAGPWPEAITTMAPAWLQAQAEAEGFLHWELAFPEVRTASSGSARPERCSWDGTAGFDLVLGNPPWVVTTDEAVERYIGSRFAQPGGGEVNVHHAYMALARRLLPAEGGRTYYVLSREWLTSPVGAV
ncbi:MAG: hypothetical protein JXC32_22525 [Anaerolineae bacterium]|nr:hypothetical protein [Anaerolineae bacterium]